MAMSTSKSYMITNRAVDDDDANALGGKLDATNTLYFTSTKTGDALKSLSGWDKQSGDQFRAALAAEAGEFPTSASVFAAESNNEKQKHVTLFVHGFNTGWVQAVERYQQIKNSLFKGAKGLGIPVLFTWPSNGNAASYLPDREDARASAAQLADVFVQLHEHLTTLQRAAAISGIRAGSVEGSVQTTVCRAKVSVIAHSMGNYVLQNALAIASRKLNNPQLITLIHQLVMVAADVDNDIFQTDKPNDSDGALMANLCYRITALFTGLDQVLGASAGLKHFGTRRLGRSGLADRTAVYDNVCDMDVTRLIEGQPNTHSAVFDTPASRDLLVDVLRGVDRGIVVRDHLAAVPA